MQRPVMNPLFMEGAPPVLPPKRGILRGIHWILRAPLTLLTADLCFWRRARLKVEDGPLWQRAIKGLLYRVLFLPVLLFLVLAAMVWIATHPWRTVIAADPLSVGAYYDPVSFTSADGVRLDAWIIPMINAKSVVEQKEKILKARFPAVVLVHDMGNNRTQMLPLIKPLHEAGFVVLVLGLRGSGPGTGTTFGLREAADVQAAVNTLRRCTGVDPNRVAVLGVGTGANAALLAATDDDRIAALVLDHPVTDVDEMISRRLSPPQRWLRWAAPLSKWIFEVAYRVDADDLNFRRCKAAVKGRAVLMFDASSKSITVFQRRGIVQACDFLSSHLKVAPNTNLATTDTH